jgi:cytochrome c-type biogenesis protein CcsB
MIASSFLGMMISWGSAFSGAPESPFFTITFALYLLAFVAFSFYGAVRRGGLARVAVSLLALGGIAHTVAIGVRWHAAGRFPFANMYEYANIMAWMAVVSFLLVLWRFRKPIFGIYVSPLVVVVIVSASMLPNDVQQQLVPALQSFWLPIHVVLAALGEGAFLVATAASIMYLISQRKIEHGGQPAITLDVLEDINFKALSIGYPLFTVGGLFAGAIWAYSAWGAFWSWDPKEVGALVIWLFYTLFLHARYYRGWRGKKAAWMSIIGFVMILLSFFGNIFLGGQHAYG